MARYYVSSGQIGSGIIGTDTGINKLDITSLDVPVSDGGTMAVPGPLPEQLVYLDFDGELTRYNGEILTVENVAVEDSGLTAERIENILTLLNRQFDGSNVRFVTERPKTSAYSTVYVGKTSAFDPYGRFAGLAETVDSGNANRSDNAFVMLDASSSDEEIVNTIIHETGHLLGILDHGGEELARLATYKVYNIFSGDIASGIPLYFDSMYVYDGGTANDILVSYGGRLHVWDDSYLNNPRLIGGGPMYECAVYVSSGGHVTGATANTWGDIYVYNGGTADYTTVNWNGGLDVYSGGVANYTTIYGGGNGLYVYSSGVLNHTVLSCSVKSEGEIPDLHILGGIANDIEVNVSTMVRVCSGGTASQVTVNSGVLYVSSGGTANQIAVNGGLDLTIYRVDYNGGLTVLSGGTATNIIAESGAFLAITVAPDTYIQGTSGGSAFEMKNALISGYTINPGNHLYVSNGTANSTTVNSGGSLSVSSGGTANVTTINCGYLHVTNSGTANSTTVNSGGSLAVSGTANQIIVNVGGHLTVSSGGTALQITENGGYVYVGDEANVTFVPNTLSGLVLSGGLSATVHSGTTANSTTVYDAMTVVGGLVNETFIVGSTHDRGHLGIASGGTANSTIVDFGYLNVHNGGTANSTTVNFSGQISVSSGGTANGTIVNPVGYLFVYNGGTANKTIVNSGGLLGVLWGGTANETTVNSNGYMRISSGGTANETTVNAGGSLYVSYGGTALQIRENGGYVVGENVTFASNTFSGLVLSGGQATVHSGTTANATTLSGGALYVYGGGTANSTILSPHGTLYVSSGGTAEVVFNPWGGTVNSAAGAVVAYLQRDAGVYFGDSSVGIISKGNALTLNISSGQSGLVYSDGTVNSTTVNSGGGLYVSSGGTATQIRENGGFVDIADGAIVTFAPNTFSGLSLSGLYHSVGSTTIHSGTTANETTVDYLYDLYVCGGTANSTTVNAGCFLHVCSGGSANSTVVNSYGVLYVFSGGTANYTTVNSSGYLYVTNSGTANDTTVNSGGVLWVSSGGMANETTVNGGRLYVSSGGTANSTVVNSYGVLYVFSGGTANCTTVNSNSYLIVSSGGTANETQVNIGGSLTVSSGGTASIIFDPWQGRITSYAGAEITYFERDAKVYYGGISAGMISKGDTLSGIEILSGNSLLVYSGGTANNTTVSGYSATLSVSSGGTANATTIDPSGRLTVSDGGEAKGTVVSTGGVLAVENGGTADDTQMLGGYAVVWGTANSVVFVSAGNMDVKSGGTANGTVINTGGLVYVSNGGMANATTVNAGGMLTVSSNAVANVTTVNGRLNVLSGGTAAEISVGSGGSVYISRGGAVAGLQLEEGAYVCASSGAVINFDLTDRTAADAALVNNLELVQGTPDFTITVSASQDYGVYRLADGAAGFNRTMTISNTAGQSGSLAVGGMVQLSDQYYMLRLETDSLSLAVLEEEPDLVPPVIPTVSADITELTDQPVTVTATFSEDSVVREYSFDGTSWSPYTDGVVMTANGIVYFRAADAAWNYSDVASYTVSNILSGSFTDLGVITSSCVVNDASIAEAGEVDMYSFTLESDGFVTLRTSGVAGGDTVITLYDAAQNQLAYNDDGGTDRYSLLTEEVSAGTYLVTVEAYGNSTISNYSLTLAVSEGEPDIIPPVIPTVSADITESTDQPVTVTATFSDDSAVREYSFDSTSWNTYTEDVVMTTNGTVYFRAADAAWNYSNIASYTVSNIIVADHNDSFETAADLGIISSAYTFANAAVDPSGDLDYYKFTLASDKFTTIETEGIAGGDTILKLYDAEKNLLGSNDDGGSGYYSKLVKTLAAGTYYAEVSAYNGSTISSYSLTITPADEPETTVLSGQYNTTVSAYGDVIISAGTTVAAYYFPGAVQVLSDGRTVTVGDNVSLSFDGIRNADILFGDDAYWGGFYDGTVIFTGQTAEFSSTVSNCIRAAGIVGRNLTVNFTGEADNSRGITFTAGQGTGPVNEGAGIYAEESLTINGSFGGTIHAQFDFSTLTASRQATMYGMGAGSGDLTFNGSLSGVIAVSAWTGDTEYASYQSAAYGLRGQQNLTVTGEISGTIAALSETTSYAISAYQTISVSVSGTVFAGRSVAGESLDDFLLKLADPDTNRSELAERSAGNSAIHTCSSAGSIVSLNDCATVWGDIVLGNVSTLTISSEAKVYGEVFAGDVNFDLRGTAEDYVITGTFCAMTVSIDATRAQNGRYALSGDDWIGVLSVKAGDQTISSITLTPVDGVYSFVFKNGMKVDWKTTDGLVLTVSNAPVPVEGFTAGDLNADGRADIVMTIAQDGHPADGSTGAWLIQEDQTAAWGDLSTRGTGWEIFGTGKTAAGKNTDDVYIKNEGNIVGAWTTGDDGKVTGWETVGEFSADTQIVGLGDFNGNGQTDLLLRNNNGAVGCFFTSDEKHGWNYFQSIGDEWKLSAVGDLNGDGRDDVVLKHDVGFAGCWLTQEDGTMAWADLDTLPDGFEIVGAGDFNADGTDDVLLKSGSYYGAWLVNNGNAAGWMGLGDLGDVTVEQIADFNGDGVDDLRIRTAAGDIGAQLVMGEDTLDWHYYGAVGAEWKTSLAALN